LILFFSFWSSKILLQKKDNIQLFLNLKFEEKQDEFEFATTILFEFEVAGKNKMNNSLDLTPLNSCASS
jgi:hypothetical protein